MKETIINRRRFIGRSSLAIGALFVPKPLHVFGTERKLGVALVGLGRYSTNQLGPALKQTQYCTLAGVVTGSKEKGEQWARDYGFPLKNIYSYDNMSQLAGNKDIICTSFRGYLIHITRQRDRSAGTYI